MALLHAVMIASLREGFHARVRLIFVIEREVTTGACCTYLRTSGRKSGSPHCTVPLCTSLAPYSSYSWLHILKQYRTQSDNKKCSVRNFNARGLDSCVNCPWCYGNQ